MCAGSEKPKALRLLEALFDGEPWGTRTSGPQLRRLLLYPAELMTLERVMGIEPTWSAWKAEVLPLNYTRISALKSSAYVYYTKVRK